MQRAPYLNVALLLGVLVCAVLYIGQINQAASMGFEMKTLQTRIDNLQVANQELEYRVADNRAMHTVSRRVSVLGMVRPSGVSYVSSQAPTVALLQ